MFFSGAAMSSRHKLIPSRFFIRLTLILTALMLCGAYGATRAATITVLAGGNLQSAINNAQPGDTIILQAGATFIGPITLPYKQGTNTDADWITIRTSTPDNLLPSSTQRITPSDAPLLPKIVAPSNSSALLTAPRAHHYRIIGIEFAKQSIDAVVNDMI